MRVYFLKSIQITEEDPLYFGSFDFLSHTYQLAGSPRFHLLYPLLLEIFAPKCPNESLHLPNLPLTPLHFVISERGQFGLFGQIYQFIRGCSCSIMHLSIQSTETYSRGRKCKQNDTVRCQDCGDRRRSTRERKNCLQLCCGQRKTLLLHAVDVESFTTEDCTIGCNCTIKAGASRYTGRLAAIGSQQEMNELVELFEDDEWIPFSKNADDKGGEKKKQKKAENGGIDELAEKAVGKKVIGVQGAKV